MHPNILQYRTYVALSQRIASTDNRFADNTSYDNMSYFSLDTVPLIPQAGAPGRTWGSIRCQESTSGIYFILYTITVHFKNAKNCFMLNNQCYGPGSDHCFFSSKYSNCLKKVLRKLRYKQRDLKTWFWCVSYSVKFVVKINFKFKKFSLHFFYFQSWSSIRIEVSKIFPRIQHILAITFFSFSPFLNE